MQCNGLLASSTDETELKGLLGPIDAMFTSEDFSGTLLECMGVLVEDLADEATLVGSDSSKEAATWWICVTILYMAGIQIEAPASSKDLWNAAKERRAADWLRRNTSKRRSSPAEQSGTKRHRTR